jgi:hypothetical protein
MSAPTIQERLRGRYKLLCAGPLSCIGALELVKEAADALDARDAEIARLRAALSDAKWDFARIAQMHSIDDAPDRCIVQRCMAEGRLGVEKTRTALSLPTPPGVTSPGVEGK